MNFLQHRQKTRHHVLPIPNGLQELMGDISREVLRCQPTQHCIYKFIADYLDAMIETRHKSRIAMRIIEEAIQSTDEVYSQFVKCNIPKEKTTEFLDIMETTFRRFIEQKRRLHEDPRYITFRADDMLEELIRKVGMTKVEILRSRPAIQWAYKKFVQTYISAIEGTFNCEDLYLDTGKLVASCKEYDKLQKSAIKIQSIFRGYHARKMIRKQYKKSKRIIHATPSFMKFTAENQAKLTDAALKIQAVYKGFKVRKKVKRMKAGGSFSSISSTSSTTSSTTDAELHRFAKFAEVNKEALAKAATKIQATYKGFLVRSKKKEAEHHHH